MDELESYINEMLQMGYKMNELILVVNKDKKEKFSHISYEITMRYDNLEDDVDFMILEKYNPFVQEYIKGGEINEKDKQNKGK